ncbi:MAG: YcgN family cysteine cluster protein [Gammaproteobacteria bacterium]|nr:YcgN family cysteine cluster protein [Gammaproteobacteria bacterium]MDH5629263.1 YcgN family cysteine cluster protein [Gammaproteobacteria bacterium]
MKDKFWQRIPLQELNEEQWESLCDGCCQCCAHKLEDEDTGEIFKTNVVCEYLDTEQCHCRVYPERHQYVPDCIKITPQNAGELPWVPETCSYRLLAHGKPLPEWHPLLTGQKASTGLAGKSVSGKVISEADINEDDMEDFIVEDDYFDK